MPKNISGLLPLAIIALIAFRRAGRSQSVRTRRMWITPLLSIIAVAMTLAEESVPGLAATAILLVGAAAGIGAGYFRALHLELTIDSKGNVSSKATPIGTYLVAGFFLLRVAIDYAVTGSWQPGPPRFVNPTARGVDLLRLADAALIFSTAMMVSQRVEIWRRAQRLVKDYRGAAEVVTQT